MDQVCTYYLFRKTEGLILCCFKCLDCWIKCNDIFCCCCKCYANWLKQDIEFSNAAHEYSNSLSKEIQIQLPDANASPQSMDSDEELVEPTPSEPLATLNPNCSAGSLSTPKRGLADMPPELALHMRHFSSTHSKRNLMSPRSVRHKRQVSKSNRAESIKSSKTIPIVEYTRQLSITTHATLS